ncbi:shikimate kinase [Inquilinus sp. KBS0705]|nr:shikimate kinase [Inquilinus sp. KBS0705]
MSLIFLIGFMGCGKTSWGKKLSAGMQYNFIDLDHALEEKAGMSVADYFATHGEDAFRRLESEVLKQTNYPQNTIVSTGGGLPCFFDHMDWMNSHGQTLYIKLSPKTLADRLENARIKRPLLHGKHGDELVNFIAQKLAEREGFYNQATHIIDGINMSVDGLIEVVKG